MQTPSGIDITVDEDAFFFLRKYSWTVAKRKPYPSTTIKSDGKEFRIRMSRFLLGVENDRASGLVADHINHIPLDSRLCNLRLVPPRVNCQNRTKKANTQTRFIGVAFVKKTNHWRASCSNVKLGTFATAEEAAFAYDEYVRSHFPPGAQLNHVREPLGGIKKITQSRGPKITQIQTKRDGIRYLARVHDGSSTRYKRFLTQETAEAWINSMLNSTSLTSDKKKRRIPRQQGWQVYPLAPTRKGESRFLASVQTLGVRKTKTCTTVDEARKWILEQKPEAVFNDTNELEDAQGFYLLATGNIKVRVNRDVALQYLGKHLTFNGGGYPCLGINNQLTQLHRLVIDAKSGQIVDHLNGDKLCCLRENLVISTPSENAYNKAKRKSASSQYYGVKRHLDGGWVVKFKCENKPIYGGYYQREDVAAFVADQLASRYWGKRAKLNGVECPEGFCFDAVKERAVVTTLTSMDL